MATPKNLRALFAQTKQAAERIGSDLDALRDEIAALNDRAAVVKQAKRPRAETEDAVRRQIQALAADFRLPFAAVLTRPGGSLFQARPEFKLAAERDPMAFAAAIAPDALFTLATRELDEAYAGGDGLSDDQREGELARIAERLLALECAEEATVRSMESAGLPVTRRPDADPAVVLAADADLPA